MIILVVAYRRYRRVYDHDRARGSRGARAPGGPGPGRRGYFALYRNKLSVYRHYFVNQFIIQHSRSTYGRLRYKLVPGDPGLRYRRYLWYRTCTAVGTVVPWYRYRGTKYLR